MGPDPLHQRRRTTSELPTESVALVLERALIHHLEALEACLKRFLDPMVRTKASWLNIAL